MKKENPKVSVLISTYNRPKYLAEAIESVIKQSYQDWELIVINDGGQDVTSVVANFNDKRIAYHNETVNRGAARRFNQGLSLAKGQYIAYLGDDDHFYPNHLEALATALDENPQIALAYSDLYAVSCVIDPQTEERHVLDKRLSVSRDFNREFMFHYNHVLHVSLMHRKEAALRVGGFDESVKVLIEWSLNRRLSFIYDFLHVEQATGQYYMPIFKSDRISVRERRNKESYRHNLRKIKCGLPSLPWPKIKQLAIIYPVDKWGQECNKKIEELIDNCDFPFRLLLINNGTSLSLKAIEKSLGQLMELKNITILDSPKKLDPMIAYRLGAKKTKAEFLFLISNKLQIVKKPKRIFASLEFLKKNPESKAIKWDVEEEKQSPYDCLIERDYFLKNSIPGRSNLVDIQSVTLNVPKGFKFDAMYSDYKRRYAKDDLSGAREILELILKEKKGTPHIQYLIHDLTKIAFKQKDYKTIEKEAKNLINRGYKPDNYIRLGLALKKQNQFTDALKYLHKALEEHGINENSLESICFPLRFPKELGIFQALLGLGKSYLGLQNYGEAARYFHWAAKIRANSHKPFLGFAHTYMGIGQLDKAEIALSKMPSPDAQKDPETHRTLSLLCRRNKRLDLAFDCLCTAFKVAPYEADNVDPYYFTGASLQKWTEMEKTLSIFMSKNPNDANGAARLAATYSQLNQILKARKTVTQGLKNNPNHPVLKSLAERLKEQPEYQQATTEMTHGALNLPKYQANAKDEIIDWNKAGNL